MKQKQNRRDERRRKTARRLWKGFVAVVRRLGDTIRLSSSSVCREAKLPPSTFYNNYRDLDEVLQEAEAEVREAAQRMARRYERQPDSLAVLFLQLLKFVHAHREYFEVAYYRGSTALWAAVLEEIRPVVTQSWSRYGSAADDAAFFLYEYEFMAVVMLWCRDGFPMGEIDHYARRLVRVTENAGRRIGRMLIP